MPTDPDRVVSRPGSPRKRPTNCLSGPLRPAIVSPCHRRASSTAGTSLRAARSRTSRRTPTRFCRSLGLSASQSATYQLAHQPLGGSLGASCLTLHWVLSGRFGFGVGELRDRRFEVRVRVSVSFDATKRLLEFRLDGRGAGIEGSPTASLTSRFNGTRRTSPSSANPFSRRGSRRKVVALRPPPRFARVEAERRLERATALLFMAAVMISKCTCDVKILY